MKFLEYYEAMCRVGASFFTRGLSGGASGNMSLRLPDGCFLVTPTGLSLGELRPDCLSLLDAQGQHKEGARPTKEAFMHLACYAARPQTGAVVHLHSPHATAWACLVHANPGDVVPPYTPYGLMRYGRVACVPYRKPGSSALADDMRAFMPHHAAVLLANHGSVVTGTDMVAAANNAEELEESCRLALLLKGHHARQLTADEQKALLEIA